MPTSRVVRCISWRQGRAPAGCQKLAGGRVREDHRLSTSACPTPRAGCTEFFPELPPRYHNRSIFGTGRRSATGWVDEIVLLSLTRVQRAVERHAMNGRKRICQVGLTRTHQRRSPLMKLNPPVVEILLIPCAHRSEIVRSAQRERRRPGSLFDGRLPEYLLVSLPEDHL